MRLLFVSDNFPPEVNAPATRTYEHCREWVKAGVEVTVITCVPNFPQGKVYDGYRNKLLSSEVVDGIKVIRVWSYISPNKGIFKRTFDFFSFALASFLAGLFIKTDLIIATSPQFLAAISGMWLSFFKRKPWVMEVRDLWPASVVSVGALEEGVILRCLRWVELRLYKSAAKIVVVTDSFSRVIKDRGIEESKICVIKNGANLSLYKSQRKELLLEESLGLKDKFVLGYIGTHGMAHRLEFILECAAALSHTNCHFLFVGAGAEKDQLINFARRLEIKNVTFLDPVNKEEVWKYISISDVMVVPLKKSDIFKTVIPSKIFETSAMQTPILLGVDGEARNIIESYNAGLFFEPEDLESFISATYKMKTDEVLYESFQKGCKNLSVHFSREKLALAMLKELEEVLE